MNYLTMYDVIVIGIVTLILAIPSCIFLIVFIKMKKRMEELSRMMFTIIKKDDKYDNSHDSIKRALSIINNNIGSLSSSTDQMIKDLGNLSKSTNDALHQLSYASNKEVFPTPNVAKMMRETILDSIRIEMLLSNGMKIPNKQSTDHIIDVAIQTYPHIDKEYTIKMCLAMIQNFIENELEGRESKL